MASMVAGFGRSEYSKRKDATIDAANVLDDQLALFEIAKPTPNNDARPSPWQQPLFIRLPALPLHLHFPLHPPMGETRRPQRRRLHTFALIIGQACELTAS